MSKSIKFKNNKVAKMLLFKPWAGEMAHWEKELAAPPSLAT